MRGIDAKFLYSETPTAHMHTLKVVVVPDDISYEAFVQGMERQLAHLAPLRRRVVPVPLALGHPVWVLDPQFDLRHHVSRRRVAAPGGPRELADVVADIASRPLARERPLWEAVFVEGLRDRESAIVAKVHHAVADGGASVALLGYVGRTFSHGPTDDLLEGPESEPLPTTRQLLTVAMQAHRRRLVEFPDLMRRSLHGMREFLRRRRAMAVPPAMPLQAPRTSLNASLDRRRTFAMTALPLDDLKAIRRATGTTLNDVYVTVCAGALRQYLLDRGELPARSLVASVPLSTSGGIGHLLGNRVDNLYVALATDVASPLERLMTVHREALAAKDLRSALGNELMEQRADVVPPQLFTPAVRLWSRTHLANRVRPPLNVVISNVAGPREALEFGPVIMRALYSVGPILEGIGINITAWSYIDQLFVSVLGCPTTLPDPWPVVALIRDSLEKLCEVAVAPA